MCTSSYYNCRKDHNLSYKIDTDLESDEDPDSEKDHDQPEDALGQHITRVETEVNNLLEDTRVETETDLNNL